MSTSHRQRGSRGILVGLALLGLSACQTRTRAPPPEPAPPPVTVERPAGAREYRLIPDESLLQILVYRGGAMARLGHNHVIASHQLSGPVYVTDDPGNMRFDIEFPVDSLTVDEPGLRAVAGPEFSATVPETARESTRGNLLSEPLLDAAHFPLVRLRATDVRAADGGYDVGVEVTLKGTTHVLRVPMTIERAAGAIFARGEFPLKQSQLGLRPFTVALGALVVVDEMRIRFEVVARQ